MSPLELLRDYERRLRQRTPLQAREEESKSRWSGIAFRLAEDVLLAPMSEVAEILDPPPCTRVPGTRSWFMGIANVRGSLLPVTDLHGFAYGGRAAQSRNAKLLVFNRDGIHAGIKVDDVLGLKQFRLAEASDAQGAVHETLQPYIERSFRQGETLWPVLSLARLAHSRAFLQIGKAPGAASEQAVL